MSEYSDFANVYDLLMKEVDYKEKTEFLFSLFNKYGKAPSLLLDLACGTGGFSNSFALYGVDVIGVDMSEDMLTQARENSEKLGNDILYLCQKAEELDLYGTVDGAICCLDSINHITDEYNLIRVFERVALFLEKGGLFIFDVNTPYKHKKILENNTFIFDEENVFCVWQNSFNENDLTVDISLDFFVETEGIYQRFSEDFTERAYTREHLKAMLNKAGLEIVEVLSDYTETKPTETSEREIYIVKHSGL